MSCCVRLVCDVVGGCLVNSRDQRVEQHEAGWGLMGIHGFEL